MKMNTKDVTAQKTKIKIKKHE
uniref:Transposase n=1 Tax=Heterorhabditis bacteriophora TaxID=37862 RepID=A0A1I7XFN9_HETBA